MASTPETRSFYIACGFSEVDSGVFRYLETEGQQR
jgi:hypothetical protein